LSKRFWKRKGINFESAPTPEQQEVLTTIGSLKGDIVEAH